MDMLTVMLIHLPKQLQESCALHRQSWFVVFRLQVHVSKHAHFFAVNLDPAIAIACLILLFILMESSSVSDVSVVFDIDIDLMSSGREFVLIMHCLCFPLIVM